MSKYSIEVHGAGKEIGRSSFIFSDGQENILLDYGVKLTPEETTYPLPIEKKLDAFVLSHAHFDHSGFVPHLFKEKPVKAFMTKPTLELSRLLWHDAIKIAESDGKIPAFSKHEIAQVDKHTMTLPYKKKVNITKNTQLEFVDAGHILGSAMVKLTNKDKTFVYTGDYMASPIRLHDGADLKSLGKVDYLMMESTYGNRVHPDREKTIDAFMKKIQETIDRGGSCVIAAFAIGRTQEILDMLFERGIDAPVFLDGMSRKATQIYNDFPQYNKKPKVVARMLQQLNVVVHPGIRKQALKEPSVIITTAGMLEGGPVQFYLNHLHGDHRSSLLITGYQVKGTKGRTLLETGKIELETGVVEPKMEIQRFDFSAHSGKDDLLKTIDLLDPEHIVLIHGDELISAEFAAELRDMGRKVSNPGVGETVVL